MYGEDLSGSWALELQDSFAQRRQLKLGDAMRSKLCCSCTGLCHKDVSVCAGLLAQSKPASHHLSTIFLSL